jgi:hypothetical protein
MAEKLFQIIDRGPKRGVESDCPAVGRTNYDLSGVSGTLIENQVQNTAESNVVIAQAGEIFKLLTRIKKALFNWK